MSKAAEIPARPGDRSPEARRAARARKAERETRIIGLLNRGVSIAEIAGGEGVSLNRMRRVGRAILTKRMPQPPAEHLALQVGRLDEALLISCGLMDNTQAGAHFPAIDGVVKIVREMDRRHGFAPAGPRAEVLPRRVPALGETRLALAPPVAGRVVTAKPG